MNGFLSSTYIIEIYLPSTFESGLLLLISDQKLHVLLAAHSLLLSFTFDKLLQVFLAEAVNFVFELFLFFEVSGELVLMVFESNICCIIWPLSKVNVLFRLIFELALLLMKWAHCTNLMVLFEFCLIGFSKHLLSYPLILLFILLHFHQLVLHGLQN